VGTWCAGFLVGCTAARREGKPSGVLAVTRVQLNHVPFDGIVTVLALILTGTLARPATHMVPPPPTPTS